MTSRSIAQVDPESLLTLTITGTLPGFGATDPLSVAEEPSDMEGKDTTSVVEVPVRKFAVSAMGPFMVTDEGLLVPV